MVWRLRCRVYVYFMCRVCGLTSEYGECAECVGMHCAACRADRSGSQNVHRGWRESADANTTFLQAAAGHWSHGRKRTHLSTAAGRLHAWFRPKFMVNFKFILQSISWHEIYKELLGNVVSSWNVWLIKTTVPTSVTRAVWRQSPVFLNPTHATDVYSTTLSDNFYQYLYSLWPGSP